MPVPLPKWVFTGPESAGKTTLAVAAAQLLPGSLLIEEFARPYLGQFPAGYAYTRQDVLHIAAGQRWLETAGLLRQPQALVCDTDLLTIHLWLVVKYGHAPHWLWHSLRQSAASHYFLCVPDLPWEPDPLREAPDDAFRWYLFERYEQALRQLGVAYSLVSGAGEARLGSVRQWLH